MYRFDSAIIIIVYPSTLPLPSLLTSYLQPHSMTLSQNTSTFRAYRNTGIFPPSQYSLLPVIRFFLLQWTILVSITALFFYTLFRVPFLLSSPIICSIHMHLYFTYHYSYHKQTHSFSFSIISCPTPFILTFSVTFSSYNLIACIFFSFFHCTHGKTIQLFISWKIGLASRKLSLTSADFAIVLFFDRDGVLFVPSYITPMGEQYSSSLTQQQNC